MYADKTKNMFLSHRGNDGQNHNIQLASKSFEIAAKYK